ncbi:MAG: translation initiation factor IF-2 [Patescibacteria group bacterium]
MAKLEQKVPASPAGGEKEIRPPVVAILGHIDHGKSTLIDYIRKTNVTGLEAGGITQHVSAYEISHTSKDGRTKLITLLDTPGHEAFSGIRTRSTNIADIAVLVVSAEDGVKPQTVEVIKYIKKSSLPFLVAITKVDKPSADIMRTKQNLAENEIYVEGYGGDTPVVEVSGKTGKGVDELLDMIGLMAEMESKMGTRDALGSGVIIETRRDAKRGISAVGIIKDGTVRQGLFAASLGAIAPIRFLLDSLDNMVEELSFSSPVQITGWDKMPEIGEEFKTFLKKDEAVEFAKVGENKNESTKLVEKNLENMNFLPLVIKADTAGSLEAIMGELGKLGRERIVPKIVLSSIGSVNENDIKSALTASGSIILSFNTKIDPQANLLAERLGVTILTFGIIYDILDKVKELLQEREPKIEVEEIIGSSKVLKLFDTTKGKQVVGCRVLSGQIKKGVNIKIMRRDAEIGRGRVKELQQSKIATDSVNEGTEFGAMIESKMEVAPGDVLNAISLITK